jgi:hypothetical protein
MTCACFLRLVARVRNARWRMDGDMVSVTFEI